MNKHEIEKFNLEKAAMEIFLRIFNANNIEQVKIEEKRECPDYILRNSQDELIGIEVTHLYYDIEEAKMLLGRSNCQIHTLENSDNLISSLNALLKQKEKKFLKYKNSYPTALLIRNANPIFGMSSLLANKNLIYKPNGISNIWFVSKDGNNNEWLLKDLLQI